MKYLAITLAFSFQYMAMHAQDNCEHYNKYMKKGDFEIGRDSFTLAFEAYSIAQVHCPDSADVAMEKILLLFRRIEQLRIKAVLAERNAKQALEQLRKEQEKNKQTLEALKQAQKATTLALEKAQKLVSAFYFYDDKYAMAIGGDIDKMYYYFINKNGDKVEKFKQWDYTEQFDRYGFAKVMIETGEDIWDEKVMDSLGNSYTVAYSQHDVKESTQVLYLTDKGLKELDLTAIKGSSIEVLVLGNNALTDIPKEIETLKQLKHLNLSKNQFALLPKSIGQLNELNILNLRRNKLSDLPDEIGLLRNLKSLDLRKNNIPNDKQERIRQLLPNCNILF